MREGDFRLLEVAVLVWVDEVYLYTQRMKEIEYEIHFAYSVFTILNPIKEAFLINGHILSYFFVFGWAKYYFVVAYN